MLLRRFPAICLLLIAGLISPMPARAGLFEQLAVCPAASSLGSAVTAYPEGCGGLAVHFNPAH
ncbi:MAG TPA: outer membrane transport protein, partial [Deltaproteobacteria bacterium]|nr:outer membrane transport protein [Deltaproteobacteria bacterium]